MWYHVQNSINLTLRSKVNVVSRSWMYVIYRLMVIDHCAKYDMKMSNRSWPWGQRWRSYWNHECTQHIVLSWWYTGPCAKYGMPINVTAKRSYKPNKNLHRQIDRQSDSYLSPKTLYGWGRGGIHVKSKSCLLQLNTCTSIWFWNKLVFTIKHHFFKYIKYYVL